MKKKWICTILVLLCCLAACQGKTYPDETLHLVVTEETIEKLEQYPNLKEVDLSGSTCYEAIAKYMAEHPQVKVIYTVNMGGSTIHSTMQNLTLLPGSFDYETLKTNLKYLPDLKKLTLPNTDLDKAQLDALRAACPQLELVYTVKFSGVEAGNGVTKVDISYATPENLEEVIAKLELVPELTHAKLSGPEGSALSREDVKRLQEKFPHILFDYSFELFGQTVSTAQERIEFVKADIGNEGVAQLKEALELLQGCTYLLLDDCGLDDEVAAALRSEYAGTTKVVWRVFHRYDTGLVRSWLTDTDTLRAVYHVDDTNSHLFRYLTEVKYVDLGHNLTMHDLSFLSYMPNLEIAILSGSEISDLSPLAGSKKLEFLELGWCGWLKDISPLAGCESLAYLNLSHTSVKDLSPLDGLPLKQLHYVNSGNKAGFTEATWQGIQQKHPDCWITYSPLKDGNANPYGTGWRYTKDGKYTDIYRKVRDVFNYDQIDQDIANGKDNNTTTEQPTTPPVEVQGPTYTPPTGDAAVEKLDLVVTADSISQLEKYPILKEVNLTGSTCYGAIAAYMAKHPQVKVTYTVGFGGSGVAKNSLQDLTLSQGNYTFEKLLTNLQYMTSLKSVTLPATDLTATQLTQLRQTYPEMKICYTLSTQAAQLSTEVSSVDLSDMRPEQVADMALQLAQYPNIVYVELMDAAGSSALSIADVKTLQDANPGVIFHYSFTLGGKTVSTTDARIEYKGATLDSIGQQNLRDALDILDSCNYFLLDNNTAAINNVTMASIRDAYPHIKIVWRIYHDSINTYDFTLKKLWKDSLLTDTEVLRAVYGVDDTNSSVFKYLTDVKYVDLGHDTQMHDLSFFNYMPNLEIVILSGSEIMDLSPLANHEKLEFLEVAWCGWLKDISPLASCPNLKYLNLSHTRVKDLSPLKDLPLELLKFVNSGSLVGFTAETWNTVQEQHPGCWITWEPLSDSVADPYATGWRTKKAGGYTYAYRRARDVFGYDFMG